MSRAKHGWLTPETLAGDEICRPLFLPANDEVLALVGGALSELTKPYNYEQNGAITPAEISEFMTAAILRWYDEQCGGAGGTPTPFWDDIQETDDEFPADEQPWYGYVADPFASPNELTLIEQVGIWAFTGLLAVSGLPAAAIAFHTFAPDFVLAMRGDDFAEVIRVIIDGEDYVTVETSGDPDERIDLPIFPSDNPAGHDILIVLREILS